MADKGKKGNNLGNPRKCVMAVNVSFYRLCFNRSLTAREEHLKKKRFNVKEILSDVLHHSTG